MIVYHLSEAKWAIQNLQKKRIKIAEIHELNDPFELAGPDIPSREQRNKFRSWRNKMANNFGLVCFSRNWSNSVLWSHYGEKHRGIALGFEIAPTNLIDVIYTITRLPPNSLSQAYGPYAEEYVRKLLSTKFTDWAYEAGFTFQVHDLS